MLFSQNQKMQLYLIPGQGSDYRIYKNLELDSNLFELHFIEWQIPEKNDNMKSFATTIAKQIDTTKPFSLIGVSLGGMIATEINDMYKAQKVIIVSSAKCRSELPFGYKMQKAFPVYKIIPKGFMKQSAFIVQPLFEPDRRLEKETCKAMLHDKDPVFVKRTVKLIMEWNRSEYDSTIVHIHGEDDNTIPIRNVNYTYKIAEGSHMMMLTKTNQINSLILKELLK